jgi:NADP-dependent 3-hydroxy acid dehydrogenase YdfG
MGLKGKVVIVTGASSGIGLATARLLAEGGAKVALAARSIEKLENLSNELPDSLAVFVEMTDKASIKKMTQTVFDHFGQIDVLINNAGRGYDASVETTDLDELTDIIELDFIGPIFAMQQVIPIMKTQGQGSIINISSGTALMHLPGMGGYAAVKAALAHMSLTAREELLSNNINVSVVYPYITLTDFEKNTIKESEETTETDGSGYKPPKADTAEFIAGKIVECINSNESEVFAHDWMKPRA